MLPDVLPKALYVGKDKIEEYTDEPWEEIERSGDTRGLLLMWQPPLSGVRYIMGGDSTEGITGWSRATRYEGDEKIDNGALEIFIPDGTYDLCTKVVDGNRVPDIDPLTNRQRRLYKDVQVAEYAAPCDPVELARVAALLGRIYAGSNDEYCELIWESWPGCGILMTQELLKINYSNLWHWEYLSEQVQETKSLGWRASPISQRVMWSRCRRHLLGHHALIRSKGLLSEYSNAEIDVSKMRAKASYGFHDDRMTAANLCFWAGHKWTYTEDSPDKVTEAPPILDYQRSAPNCTVSYERGLEVQECSYRDYVAHSTDDWWE
jgi:hypothetical protein